MSAELKSKLSEVKDQREQLEQEAQRKWAKVEETRQEFLEAGADANDHDHPLFKAAMQANAEHGEIAEKLAKLDQFRDGIFEMLGSNGNGGQKAPVDPLSQLQPGERKAIKGLVEEMADRILDGDEYKSLLGSGRVMSSSPLGPQVYLGKGLDQDETKALLTGVSDTSGGAFITNQRVGYVAQPMRMSLVRNLLTVGTTNSDAVEYARQTTFTPNAAETAEATTTDTGTKPEATIAFEKVTESVKTVANWVPATRRSLADVGQLRTIIESQLRYALEYRLESQIVNGGGTGENFTGILSTSGILSQAKGSDSVADAIHKAITKIRLGFVEPNGVGLHPNDWEVLRLARDDSGAAAGTGGYLWGPPSTQGPETVWGLPVVVGTQFPDDTGLVGDFRQAALWVREGVQVLASDSHSDFFTKNLVAILAEMRAAFGVLIPAAFCKVTSVD